MKRELLIVTHMPGETGGKLATIAEKKGFIPTVVYSGNSGEYPYNETHDAVLKRFGAVALMGGEESVSSGTPPMEYEIELAKRAQARNVPIIGVCLGGQIGVIAAGGAVVPCEPELGIIKAGITEAGKTDPLTSGMGETITAVGLHKAHGVLTPGMEATVLAETRDSEGNPINQLIRLGEVAIDAQFHAEPNRIGLVRGLEAYGSYFRIGSRKKKLILADFDEHYAQYEADGALLFSRFFEIASEVSTPP